MMNKRFIHPAVLFFLLTLIVVLLSWLGNIFGWQNVRNLLDAEGIRWILRNVLSNYLSAPWLGSMLVLSFGVGVCVHSGWWASMIRILFHGQKLSKKYMQAWQASLFVASLWIVLFVVAILDPWAALHSISGEWEGSPLAAGMSWVCAVGIALLGIVYGYMTDYYRSSKDMVAGLSYFIYKSPSVMITLFFVSQFFSSLRYSGLAQYGGMSEVGLEWIYKVFVTLSFLYR